nr:GNAT family N-acetyltransferase [Allomuricauda sp.]
MRIKRADIGDLDALVPLFDAYRQFYKQPTNLALSRQFLAERFQRKENTVFLAIVENQSVGFTQLYTTFSSVSMQSFYILNDLYVDPSYRKIGIGEALLKAAQNFCSENRFKGVALETAIDNPARKLYERLGWKKNDSFIYYFWSNLDLS